MELLTPQEVAQRRQRGLALEAEANAHNMAEASFALLSTSNLEPLIPFLLEALARIGLRGRIYSAGFGQLTQEVLDPASGLYRVAPEGVLLVPAVEDLLEPLFTR